MAVVAAMAAWSAVAAAHPLSVSYSRFNVDGQTVAAVVRVPLDDVDLLLRLDRDLDGTVADAEIEGAREAVVRYVVERVHVAAGGRPLTPSPSGVARWKDQDGFPYVEARLAYSSPDAVRAIAIRVGILTDLYADHRNLAEITIDGRANQFVFQHGNVYEAQAGGSGRWQTAQSFLLLGIEHIFTGYDHVLFLFGLLLVATGIRNLVAIVTSFTVAHSLTLSLATLGIVQPTAWTVEAAIALSIAYVGLENLFVRDVRHRWRITFIFGLVHGFGFANILREMELPRAALALSLFTFNIGVEIGQIAIVALLWPMVRYVQRTPYRVPVVRVASSIIVACGVFWFWQRII